MGWLTTYMHAPSSPDLSSYMHAGSYSICLLYVAMCVLLAGLGLNFFNYRNSGAWGNHAVCLKKSEP